MKIIIPYKKEVVFKDNINEITSISLEETLSIKDGMLTGNFLITGDYRVSNNSNTVSPFNLDLPIVFALDNDYNAEFATCDIDDFYYEIINDKKLAISIDVCVDKLKEKEMVDINNDIDVLDSRNDSETLEKIEDNADNKKELKKESISLEDEEESKNNIDLEIKEKVRNDSNNNANKPINSIFNNMDGKEEYISYSIYIVRDGDTIDDIIEKYNIDLELLKDYNDINDLKIGDKIIIPNKCEN